MNAHNLYSDAKPNRRADHTDKTPETVSAPTAIANVEKPIIEFQRVIIEHTELILHRGIINMHVIDLDIIKIKA